MKKIAVIMGGPGSEHQVSLATGRQMLANLSPAKYLVQPILIGQDGFWRFGDSTKKVEVLEALRRLQDFDVALLALHGTFGEDGKLQAMLDLINLPYTGSGVLASAMAMDKMVSAHVLKGHGLRVPTSVVVTLEDWKSKKSLPKVKWPVIVKPVSGGSSVGVSKVMRAKSLPMALEAAFKWDRQVCLQEFIAGREFTCGVLERGDETIILPPTEIILTSDKIFDYTSKYTVGACVEITPAKLSAGRTSQLQDQALLAHRALGCAGYSRTDFILDSKGFIVLETNTLPGMTETSLLPQAAAAIGIDFSELLEILIHNALR
ncbi:MAG: D-alanine--D-alanine ligase [Patescibacteria group bacterium]